MITLPVAGAIIFVAWIFRAVAAYFEKHWGGGILTGLLGYRLLPPDGDSFGTWRRGMMGGSVITMLFVSVNSFFENDDTRNVVIIISSIPVVLLLTAIALPKYSHYIVPWSMSWIMSSPVAVLLFRAFFEMDVLYPIIYTSSYAATGGFLTGLLMLKSQSLSNDQRILGLLVNVVAVLHHCIGNLAAYLCMSLFPVGSVFLFVDSLITMGYQLPNMVSGEVISLLKGLLIPVFGIWSLSVNTPYSGLVACYGLGISTHHICAVFLTQVWYSTVMLTKTEEITEYKTIAMNMTTNNLTTYSNVNDVNEDITIQSSELANDDIQRRDSISEGHTEINISNPMSEITLTASPQKRESAVEEDQQSDYEVSEVVETRQQVESQSTPLQVNLFSGLATTDNVTNGTFFSESTVSEKFDQMESEDQLPTEDALLLAVKKLQAPPTAKQKRTAKRQQSLKQTIFDLFNSMSPDGSPLTLSVINKAVDDVDMAGSILDQADTDSDGRVSLAEWMSYANLYFGDHGMDLDNVTPEVLQTFCTLFNYDCKKSLTASFEGTKKKKKKRSNTKLLI